MKKNILFVFIIFSLNIYCQDKYKPQFLFEWGHGGNGMYTQSIGVYGHTNMAKDILYLDFGGKTIIPIKHAKNNVITQALAGIQVKTFNIEEIPILVGIRGGYGWMCGKSKNFKGASIDTFVRIKLTKNLSFGYSYNYQNLGNKSPLINHINTHEGKLIYQL